MFQLLLIAALLPVTGADKGLTEKHQNWLDKEVRYIISRQEKKEFRSLESEAERDAFIERFWLRRDPDLSTELNEFREEHYRRIAYTNERFGDEGRPGWKTARGQVYITHGPPDDMSHSFGRQVRVAIHNPTTVLNPSGSPMPIIEVEVQSPASETWTYYHLEGGRSFRSFFTVMFAKMEPQELYNVERSVKRVPPDAPYDRRVSRDQAILGFSSQPGRYQRNDFRIVYAGEPRFVDLEDLILSTFHSFTPEVDQFLLNEAKSDLHRSTGEALERRLAQVERMKELVESRIFFGELPIEVGYGFLKFLRGRVSIPLRANIQIDPETPAAEIGFLAELQDVTTGRVAATWSDGLVPRDGKHFQGHVTYQSRLIAPPGRFKLRVVASDESNQRIGLWEETIEIPDLASADFGASELVLCEEVIPREQYNKRLKKRDVQSSAKRGARLLEDPLSYDDYVFVPTVNRKFRRKQNLTTLLEVYNPSLKDGAPQVDVQSSFLRNGESVVSMPARQLNYMTDKEGGTIIYAFSIPLQGFDPGAYEFEVQITDRPTGKSVLKTIPFRIR